MYMIFINKEKLAVYTRILYGLHLYYLTLNVGLSH